MDDNRRRCWCCAQERDVRTMSVVQNKWICTACYQAAKKNSELAEKETK